MLRQSANVEEHSEPSQTSDGPFSENSKRRKDVTYV